MGVGAAISRSYGLFRHDSEGWATCICIVEGTVIVVAQDKCELFTKRATHTEGLMLTTRDSGFPDIYTAFTKFFRPGFAGEKGRG